MGCVWRGTNPLVGWAPPLGPMRLGFAPSPLEGALGPRGGGAQPTKGLVPLHIQPIGPSGAGGPPEPLRWSRYNTGNPRIILVTI